MLRFTATHDKCASFAKQNLPRLAKKYRALFFAFIKFARLFDNIAAYFCYIKLLQSAEFELKF
ncbi:hypothetical protein CAMRE0001_2277 [Campylobacter rectus RM3267]|uniref:Uncharacterized protein n=1 Tax=Campylobacter rectus RM3267 TaxID=553218 RepID=B9D5A3_CAMRE|nr:hypothetical protein CAMRE0001_2277 [Campylobacter rectus RM3267]